MSFGLPLRVIMHHFKPAPEEALRHNASGNGPETSSTLSQQWISTKREGVWKGSAVPALSELLLISTWSFCWITVARFQFSLDLVLLAPLSHVVPGK